MFGVAKRALPAVSLVASALLVNTNVVRQQGIPVPVKAWGTTAFQRCSEKNSVEAAFGADPDCVLDEFLRDGK